MTTSKACGASRPTSSSETTAPSRRRGGRPRSRRRRGSRRTIRRENGAERRTTLLEDPLAVGDEQQREVPAGALAQLPVVQRRHHGLAGPCRGDDQVAVAVVALPLDLQLFEHSLLVRIGVNVEADERDARLAERRGRDARRAPVEPLAIVRPGRTARSARTPSRSRTSTASARSRAWRRSTKPHVPLQPVNSAVCERFDEPMKAVVSPDSRRAAMPWRAASSCERRTRRAPGAEPRELVDCAPLVAPM